MIRIAMIARSTLYSIRGGDTVQIMETAKHLSGLGVKVDIRLTNEEINYADYTLLHFFNIIRPADILFHIKKSRKPYVISTILIDYSEFDKYERKGLAGKLFRLLSANQIEYAKTVARWLLGKDRLVSISYLWKGQYRSIRYILNHARFILPNSALEYERIIRLYKYAGEAVIVPNGIDEQVFTCSQEINKDPLLVICAARIEGIKNQLNLINALNNTQYQLFIIGSPAPNQLSYYTQCKEIAADNIHFVDRVPQEELLSYYAKAKVHILPSWFETTGLSSLEAAALRCNVVISTRGDAKEYFGDDAFYCEPNDINSIVGAVQKASEAPHNESLQKKILSKYTWQRAAVVTFSAYQKCITQ